MEECGYNVIGIDLGTSNSCAAIWKNGQIVIVPNEVGKRTTPSVVSFLESETLIGNSATKKLTTNSKNTVFDAKRLIGHKITDDKVQEDLNMWPFPVEADKNNNPIIKIENSVNNKTSYSPEEISAMILKYLKVQAENYCGHSLTNAVITVPAYFNKLQRKATEKAARLAGLNVLQLLDEPSAAALAYNFEQSNKTERLLIYDLGGGTFDVSILEVGLQKVRVVASDGDNHLGGEDFNSNLMKYLFMQYKKQKGEDISNDPIWRSRMRNAVEACKLELSVTSSSLIEFPGSDFMYSVSRFLFENLNKELFNKTIEFLEKTLRTANLTKDMIDEVILVGGSTRIPRIQQLLQDHFVSSKMCKSINPDEAVAMGAAIMAAVLEVQRLRTYPKTALLSIGVETQGGIMEVLIPRDTELPYTCSCEFKTPTDYQDCIAFDILMGERLLTRDNVKIGRIQLTDLPLTKGQDIVITISMSLSSNYQLKVSAVENISCKRSEVNIDLDTVNALSPLLLKQEELKKQYDEAALKREQDEELVVRHREMNNLECLVEEGFGFLHKLESSMTPEWIEQMRSLLNSIKQWMKENEDAEISECQNREVLIRKNLLSYSKP